MAHVTKPTTSTFELEDQVEDVEEEEGDENSLNDDQDSGTNSTG